MPLGSEKVGFLGAAGSGSNFSAGGNYLGDGSDGDLATSGAVTYTVLNKVGSYDGDMLVKNFTSIDINAGHTVTVDQPCRGMLIYCQGDCTVGGTLSMTGTGGLSDPTTSGGSDSSVVSSTGLRLGLFTASGTDTLSAADFAGCGDAAVAAVANQPALSSDGTIFTMGKTGAAGGGCMAGGTAGTTGGVTLTTGGGGGGGSQPDGYTCGSGGTGGAFSGGAGGGGGTHCSSCTTCNGGNYGGAGGAACSSTCASAGGSGNPGGAGATGGVSGNDGSSGIIWLIVGGDLTVESGGSIEADGMGGGASGTNCAGGGGTVGGSVFCFHVGSLTETGDITAAAGGGGYAGSRPGQAGGAGGVHKAAIT